MRLRQASRARTIFSLHRCRGSSPVERGPEKAGVGSSTLPPGTIRIAGSVPVLAKQIPFARRDKDLLAVPFLWIQYRTFQDVGTSKNSQVWG